MCTRSGFQSKTDQGWSLVRPVYGRNARQLQHLLVEQIAVVGQDCRDTGIEPGALLQGVVANAHTGDISDGIEWPGRENTDLEPEISGPWP